MAVDLKMLASGLSAWIVKRGVGPFRRRRSELRRTQWLDRAGLAQYQLEKLRLLAVHTAENVPYYRDDNPELAQQLRGIRTLDDLAQLPLLRKADVLANAERMVSRVPPRWATRTAHTGGTTGTPLRLVRDMRSIGDEHAFVRRQWDWAGVGLGDRCAFLTGRVIAPPDQSSGRLWRYDPVMRELVLSTYHLRPSIAQDYADALRAHGIDVLVAYPSSAQTFARMCRERDVPLRLRVVLTSSETLSAEARQEIEALTGAKVFDFYGSAERVCYIHSCERQSYHVVPEYGVTEFLPEPGRPGVFRVVGTGFWNRAQPLLRYELGDLVELESDPCACGRHFPRVRRILGRPSACLTTPSGLRLGAAILTHLLYGRASILESQLVQDAPDRVRYRYVPLARTTAADLEELRRLAQVHLPSELRVEFEEVTSLPRTGAGKLQPIVSLIDGR